jgi:hypothetical protein
MVPGKKEGICKANQSLAEFAGLFWHIGNIILEAVVLRAGRTPSCKEVSQQ